MINEIESAAQFLSNLLNARGTDCNVVDTFRLSLKDVLYAHYQNHWFTEKPYRGSAYRCLRIVNHKMDPLISKAGGLSGLSPARLLSLLPSELTMWIDPYEVSYRIGEEGSIGQLMSEQAYDDDSSSSSGASDIDEVSQDVASPQGYLGCKGDYMFQSAMSHNLDSYLCSTQYVAS